MSENKKSDMSDSGLGFLVTVLAAGIVWLKCRFTVVGFYFKWRYAIALVITTLILAFYLRLKKKFLGLFKESDLATEILSAPDSEDSVFVGLTPKGKSVYIRQSYRRTHTQVVGTTNAGKTESIIAPWAIDDIKKGRGFIIIDGKSDRGLLNKLYAFAKKHHREPDIRILSLCEAEISHTFNPFAEGTVLEVTERVFAALSFENEYFKGIQYDALLHCLLLLEAAKIKTTPYRVVECLRNEAQLSYLAKKSDKPELILWVENFLRLSRDEREKRTSGLISQLQVFAVGEAASIFNSESSEINLEKALDENQIIYCQLPALKIPTLGKMTGKMLLQCLQSAVASRHLGHSQSMGLFSVYLDDFTEYLTPSFVTLLNKSRSANVNIVFAHQALGDLDVLGDGVKNTILTNSNLKVFMRTNEPESSEYFSSVIGTKLGEKITERQKAALLGSQKTGDASVREVEEFKFHPNIFKQELGVGEAIMVIPHSKGSYPVRVKLRKSFDLDPPEIPALFKSSPVGLPPIPDLKTEVAGDKRNESRATEPKLQGGPSEKEVTVLPDGSPAKNILQAAEQELNTPKIGAA